MKNLLSDVYPVTVSHGNIFCDADLVDYVRRHLGDDIALVLEHRLAIAKPRPQLDKKIRRAFESLEDAYNDLETVIDHIDEYDEE